MFTLKEENKESNIIEFNNRLRNITQECSAVVRILFFSVFGGHCKSGIIYNAGNFVSVALQSESTAGEIEVKGRSLKINVFSDC